MRQRSVTPHNSPLSNVFCGVFAGRVKRRGDEYAEIKAALSVRSKYGLAVQGTGGRQTPFARWP